MRGELGQCKFLTRISQDLIDFEGGLIVDFQRYANLAFYDAFVRQGKSIGFVALGGQCEGFVEPFVLYGKLPTVNLGSGSPLMLCIRLPITGVYLALTSWSSLKVVNGFTQH